jgi:serine/threonine protein phosphatase PrpC
MLRSAANVNKQLIQLEKCLVSRWGDAVYEDFLQNPYTDEEINKIPADWGFEDSVYSVYGCTCLIAAVTERYWFGLQIGDGRIVEISENGTFREPVPWDENCFLNATTSICDETAADEFRHFFSERLPNAVLICTDGVSESYREKDDFYHICRELTDICQTDGRTKTLNTLKKILPEISKTGSGDDVSVAVIYKGGNNDKNS